MGDANAVGTRDELTAFSALVLDELRGTERQLSAPSKKSTASREAADRDSAGAALSPIGHRQVMAVPQLLADGATVPFIARYRKERTASLDEVAILAIKDARETVQAREARRATIKTSLEKQGVLTEELAARLASAATLAELEDLYAPFKPKRRTRATVADAAGLTPLARAILLNEYADAEALHNFAVTHHNPEAGIETPEQALSGARDILAEWITEHPDVRAAVRELFERDGVLRCSLKRGVSRDGKAAHYRDYFDHKEKAAKAPSHRVLAMLRGEAEGVLTLSLRPSEATVIDVVTALVARCKVAWTHLGAEFSVAGCTPYSDACRTEIEAALTDGCRRLLLPSLETEQRAVLKGRADATAIAVFARNLEELLMAPPLPDTNIMAIDPGLRTGCKLVCLGRHGELLHSDTIYPLPPHSKTDAAATIVKTLLGEFAIEAIAVGNGTGGRETADFLETLGLEIPVIPVSESGASVYSASKIARDELPDQDVTVRGAVSIGRRLADPLSELVKIDAKSIGVGQYQHDVDQKALKKALDDVVHSCVNRVGVDLNSAGTALLSYVAGLNARSARAIVEQREARGGFRNRGELLTVPGLGRRVFEQCAGFLRIRDGDEPLDAGAVHPERYDLVRSMARDLGVAVSDLLHSAELRASIDLQRYIDEQTGPETLRDILTELDKPGRDPRGVLEPVRFADVHSIEDLKPGMRLPGLVTNIAAFGAFVDIGVHQDGLIHISKLADRYVRDPHEIVHIGMPLDVTVLEVDLARKRISLALR